MVSSNLGSHGSCHSQVFGFYDVPPTHGIRHDGQGQRKSGMTVDLDAAEASVASRPLRSKPCNELRARRKFRRPRIDTSSYVNRLGSEHAQRPSHDIIHEITVSTIASLQRKIV